MPTELSSRATECLKDVVARVTPYFRDVIAEDLKYEGVRGGAVLIVAHGNSLRALRMVLENISEDEIPDVEIPTGIPYRVTLDRELNVLAANYLGDPEAATKAAEAVAPPGRLTRGPSGPRSLVRIRTTCSTSVTQAIPSPTVSVRAAVHDGVDEFVDQLVGADDLDLDLVHEVEDVLLASKDLDVASGVAEAAGLTRRSCR